MKNQLNTQLKSVLSSEKIVYVFGSGISSALSGCRSSWYQWIADGIEYISDKALATELKDRMESEYSAESLISVVSCVIDATKTDGTYASWMKASVFCCQIIINGLHILAITLKRAKTPYGQY